MEPVTFNNDKKASTEEDYVFINTDGTEMDLDEESYCYDEDEDFVVFSSPSTVSPKIVEKCVPKQSDLSVSIVSLEESDAKLTDEMRDVLSKLETSHGDKLVELPEIPALKIDSEPHSKNFESDDVKDSVSVSEETKQNLLGGNDEANVLDSAAKTSGRKEETEKKEHEERESETKFDTISCGSRLSNKKRRKRLKMMKKAAAAAEAAASLEAMRQNSPKPSPPSKSTTRTRGSKFLKSKKVHNSANTAVTCAKQSLSEFRAKHSL